MLEASYTVQLTLNGALVPKKKILLIFEKCIVIFVSLPTELVCGFFSGRLRKCWLVASAFAVFCL